MLMRSLPRDPRQRRARFAKVFHRDDLDGFLQLRRKWRTFALAAFLLLLLVFAIASARALRHLESPTAELIAGALSRVLDRPVEIGHAELHLGLRLGIEIYDLRVLEADGSEHPPAFEVAYARGEQAWPRVVVGQIVPLNWDIRAPTLRIREAAGVNAVLTPPELPALNLDLREGRVEWHRADGDLLVVDELTLSARRSPLGLSMHGQARGRLSWGESGVSRFDLIIDGRPTNFTLKGAVSALDLEAFPLGPVKARGLGKGEIALGVRVGMVEARAALTFANLELEIPQLSKPIIPENNRLVVDATYSGGQLSLEFNRLEVDDLVIRGTIRYTGGPPGHLRADLHFDSFEPAASATRLQPLRALALRFATWEQIGSQIAAGRIEDLFIRIDTQLDRLADVVAFRDRVKPEEILIQLHAEGGTYYPDPESVPLEQISGDFTIRGNTLEIRGLRMKREDGDLPRIDLTIDGMHRLVRLPPEERGTPKGPGTPIPGLNAAAAAARAPGAPERAETRIRFFDFELHYPAFVLPFREARGLLRFPAGQLVVEHASGILGGAPAELAAVWDPKTGALGVQVKYLDGEVKVHPDAPREWLSGRIESDELYFGDWRVNDFSAQIDVRGADVRASELRGRLLDGEVSGTGALSLAEPDRAAFEFDLELVDARAAQLEPHLGLPGGSLTGTLKGTGRLAGALDPERQFLDHADYELSVSLQDGSLDNLPPALVLARLPSLRGVRGLLGRALPYETVDTIITIKSGTLQIDDFKLVGPELRFVASGAIDLTSEAYHADMVVAILFLRTLDRLLGALPIVRDIVLGPEKNLLAAYFQITGPWAELDAKFLAPRTIESTFGMLSGVIRGSVRQIIKILPLPKSGGDSKDDASDEKDTSSEQDPGS